MNAVDKAVYRQFCQAAERGDVCPTKQTICRIVRYGKPAVTASIQRLEAWGHIQIVRTSGGYGMVVYVPAIGKSTSEDRFNRKRPTDSGLGLNGEDLAARIEADQRAQREKQLHWLKAHQAKYGRAHGTRLITEMPA